MDEFESGIEKIADSIGDLITGGPSPIRKNFFRQLDSYVLQL